MSEPTPRFVLDYISYIKRLYKQYPEIAASKFNIDVAQVGDILVESTFASTRGWAVIQRRPVSGESVIVEWVEPPFATAPPLPPIEFDPGIPLQIPTYAPPQGYFVLIVENVGLPAGYAATTTITARTLVNSQGVVDGGAGFTIPFRAQYELPVEGFSAVQNSDAQQLNYKISYTDTVNTIHGVYEPLSVGGSFTPKSGELHRITVRWSKVDVFIPRSASPPPRPPVLLPPEPPMPPTGPRPPGGPTTRPVALISTQAQPILYPSTTPRRPAQLPLLPSTYKLTRPFKDPDNTFRATSVQQMFSFTPDTSARSIIYHIGVRPDTIAPVTYRVRNNTLNTTLQFTFDVPEFLFLNVPAVLEINAQQEVVIIVSFNESDARMKSITRSRFYTDVFAWDVEPINVNGPVYIVRNLPAISLGSGIIEAPTMQSAPPLVGQVGGRTGFDTDFFRNLYISLDPMNLSLTKNQRRGVRINAWVGDETVGPSRPGSVPLQFEANSIMWESASPTILDIDTQNAAGSVMLVGITDGTTQFKAKIVKPPINISKSRWDVIYNSQTAIVGGGRRVLLPNSISGIEIVGMVNVVSPK